MSVLLKDFYHGGHFPVVIAGKSTVVTNTIDDGSSPLVAGEPASSAVEPPQWTAAIFNVIIYTCAVLAIKCLNVCCEKD